MDQARQVRLLIPPFFLFMSIAWGWLLCGGDLAGLLQATSPQHALLVAAAAGAASIPLGFLIAMVSTAILRMGCWSPTGRTYEVGVSEESLKAIWSAVKAKDHFNKEQRLYATATFDHELFSRGVHEWIMRRWNTFNTSTNCIVALGLSHPFGSVCGISQGWRWTLSSVVLITLFLWNAVTCWRQTMAMVEFQAKRSTEWKVRT
jgi:hypothetical protein